MILNTGLFAVSLVLYTTMILTFFMFLYFRGKAHLTFFQQEEYDGVRFLKWLLGSGAIDKRTSAGVLSVFVLLPYMPVEGPPAAPMAVAMALLIGIMIYGIWSSRRVAKRSKKPLAMTARAKRILLVYQVLTVLTVFAAGKMFVPVGALLNHYSGVLFVVFFVLLPLSLLQLPPFLLVLANWLLSPLEKRTQAKYWREAKEKLDKLRPTIIAITGSYGKTSTKHILAHILSAAEPTLATPGSVNTEMGIARIVREQLEARHKYFIVEMGAYGPGSIARLCKLAPPDLGIITSVGHAHYERFKSLETVAQAKFELAEAVRVNGGKTIINAVAIPEDLLKTQLERNGNVILAGEAGQPFDMKITCRDVAETRNGLSVRLNFIDPGGVSREAGFLAPIYGSQQAGNIMLAVATALELGYPPETIQAALTTLPQIHHRLEVTLADTGPSVIDDAYNSNPAGFRAALQTLDMLGVPGGRRVLITPGMVEMGDAHDEQHLSIGKMAGACVDLALIVGPDRIPTFNEGFAATKSEGAEIRAFEKQEEAETWYKANAGDLDVVLFENNLPDLYEAKVRF